MSGDELAAAAGKRRFVCPLLLTALLLAGHASTALAIDLTAGSEPARQCNGTIVPTFHAAATAYLEPAPVASIDEYGGTQYTPDRANNIGVGVGFAELSTAAGAYCLGLFYREEAQGVATADLLDILHADHFGKPFDAGRDYRLHYDWRTLKAYGLRLRRAFNAGEIGSTRFTLALGVSLMKPKVGTAETLSGNVTASTSSYAVGTATWLRTDSDLDPESFNSFVGAGHPRGVGFSTDLQLRAQMRSGTVVELTAMDLVGRVYWHETRASVRAFDNATIRYDENLNRGAFVTGADARIRSVQRIPTKWRLALAQPITPRLTALLEDDAVLGWHFVSVGARYGSSERSIATTFDIRTRAVGLDARWGFFSASLTTDRLDWRDARTLGVSVDLSRRW
jgi:hypothetical protein